MKRATFALVLMTLPAWGDEPPVPAYWNGNKLYEELTSSNEARRWIALGYIEGVADTSAGGSNPVFGERFCVPPGVAGPQLGDVVKLYLEKHPAERHHTAMGQVANALTEAFPCQR